MRLKTARARRKRKLIPALKRRELEAFVFCNRYASIFEFKTAYIGERRFCEQVCSEAGAGYYNWKYSSFKKRRRVTYYAGHLFYEIKNRILAHRGRPQGLVMQYWTSEGFDYHDNLEYKSHSHILETIRLNGRNFHQPTGHFEFTSDDGFATYCKYSKGFDEAKKLTQGKPIFGKKVEKIDVPKEALEQTKNQFLMYLKFLIKRFRPLLNRELAREKPRVLTSNDYQQRMADMLPAVQEKQPELFEETNIF